MSLMRMPIRLPIRLAAASTASSPAAAAARTAHRPLDGAAMARRSLHDHHSQQRWGGCCITASSSSPWPHLGPSAKLLLLPRGFAAPQRRELSGMVDVDGDRPALQITERCAKRILKVNPDGMLRLRVDGGGCSGFQYKFELEKETGDEDVKFDKEGATLVIDEMSLDLVKGSKIDFVEEMISSSFQVVDNPQSESSCGCGASFSPKA